LLQRDEHLGRAAHALPYWCAGVDLLRWTP